MESSLNKLKIKIAGQPRRSPGIAEIFDWIIAYNDNLALLSSLEMLVLKGCNDFVTVKKNPFIIDCGANIGISILNYKKKYPHAQIIAFEPDPFIFKLLQKNLIVNQIQDVTVINVAVWIKNGESDFFCEGSDGSKIVAGPDKSTVKVKTIDLLDHINSQIDLIKIDIEGAELEVIPHLKNKLHRVQNLVVECHVNNDQTGKFVCLLDILVNSGFQVNINSMGQWRDLVKRPSRLPNEFDQYFLVTATRDCQNYFPL